MVFTAPQGGPLRYGNFMRRVWRPAVERAGLDETVTPHLLRHTAATLLINEGASVKDVQARLGHADAAVTLNVYSAVFDGRREDLTQRLESVRSRATAHGAAHGSGTDVARGPNARREAMKANDADLR